MKHTTDASLVKTATMTITNKKMKMKTMMIKLPQNKIKQMWRHNVAYVVGQ